MYQLVRETPVPVIVICEILRASGMNLCRARVCADVFAELGLMQYDAAADTVVRLPAAEKRTLTDSARYRDILKLAGVKAAG